VIYSVSLILCTVCLDVRVNNLKTKSLPWNMKIGQKESVSTRTEATVQEFSMRAQFFSYISHSNQ